MLGIKLLGNAGLLIHGDYGWLIRAEKEKNGGEKIG